MIVPSEFTDISARKLDALGCLRFHWNREEGDYEEHFLGFVFDDGAMNDKFLSVTFFEQPDQPVMVWLTLPGARIALKHITTMAQFLQMYKLLTGKAVNYGLER